MVCRSERSVEEGGGREILTNVNRVNRLGRGGGGGGGGGEGGREGGGGGRGRGGVLNILATSTLVPHTNITTYHDGSDTNSSFRIYPAGTGSQAMLDWVRTFRRLFIRQANHPHFPQWDPHYAFVEVGNFNNANVLVRVARATSIYSVSRRTTTLLVLLV